MCTMEIQLQTRTSCSRHFILELRHLNSVYLLCYWIGENYTHSLQFLFCEIGLWHMSRKPPLKSGCKRKIALYQPRKSYKLLRNAVTHYCTTLFLNLKDYFSSQEAWREKFGVVLISYALFKLECLQGIYWCLNLLLLKSLGPGLHFQ